VAYEVGIQQPRQHRRFANFFRHGNRLTMYFKHDATEVSDLYKRFPQVVLPSEIATKYWSKVLVKKKPKLAAQLLETSYRLLCEAATKQGRKMIEQSAGKTNRFLTFHQAAVELSQLENVYLRYTDYEEPCLLVGIRPVAKFSWNNLSTRVPANSGTAERWEVLEPDRFQEWPDAMKSAVRDAA
jgi:predicted DNA-binding protein (MmcQ/YjbR family)